MILISKAFVIIPYLLACEIGVNSITPDQLQESMVLDEQSTINSSLSNLQIDFRMREYPTDTNKHGH